MFWEKWPQNVIIYQFLEFIIFHNTCFNNKIIIYPLNIMTYLSRHVSLIFSRDLNDFIATGL